MEKNFQALKDRKLIKNLNIVSGTFMSALEQRKYSKVRRRPGMCTVVVPGPTAASGTHGSIRRRFKMLHPACSASWRCTCGAHWATPFLPVSP